MFCDVLCRSLQGEDAWITEKETKELADLAKETRDWLGKQSDLQKKAPLTTDPVLTVSTLEFKTSKIDRELVFLMRKPKPKHKKPTIILNNTTVTLNGTNATSNTTVLPNKTTTTADDDSKSTNENQKTSTTIEPGTVPPQAEESAESTTKSEQEVIDHDLERMLVLIKFLISDS